MNLELEVKDYLGSGCVRIISDRSTVSVYWKSVSGFVRKNWFNKLSQLSVSEREWLKKIKGEI